MMHRDIFNSSLEGGAMNSEVVQHTGNQTLTELAWAETDVENSWGKVGWMDTLKESV